MADPAGSTLGDRRRRRTIFLALVLGAILPLLIGVYILYAHLFPALDRAEHRLLVFFVQVLILFTAIVMAAGGYAWRALEQTNTRLEEVSFTDEVTGLYNRRFFLLRLHEEIGRFHRFGSPLSVVMFDLDGFKAVNDRSGHAAGDAALRDVAKLLREHSRGINVISRFGGDEFAVLMVETTPAGGQQYAERIRHVLAEAPLQQGSRITASFGVSGIGGDETPAAAAAATPRAAQVTGDDLLRAADAALYAAKRGGKNVVRAAGEPTTPFRL